MPPSPSCSSFSVLVYCSLLLLSVSPTFLISGVINPFFSTISKTKLDLQVHKTRPVLPENSLVSSISSVVGVVGDGVLEKGLAKARAAIRRASLTKNITRDGNQSGKIYRNPSLFYQSYLQMEKRFKVFVYEEGDLPIFHFGPYKNIYTSEGRFMDEMEFGKSRWRTKDAQRAHVYFMPFSVTKMVGFLYEPKSHDRSPLQRFVSDYIRVISTKYPFWNRTKGADHFMVSCHDWGPYVSQADPFLYHNSIRVLCNANTSEGFNPRKDVSLPEVNLLTGDIPLELLSVPSDDAPRPFLAFFAGRMHGPIRPILLQHWKGKEPDIHVYECLPKGLNYNEFMQRSKFCLCPSGYEVASPRIVEAIYTECVPVIISDHYIVPFSDVLRWEAFSIRVEVSDIPNLEKVLRAVSEEEYGILKQGVRAVRKHFVLNQPAKRMDMFNMILHSIWLRRLNLRLGDKF